MPLLPARALTLAAGLLLLSGTPPLLPQPALADAAAAAAEASNGLTVEQARAAANRILKAVQSRDPNLRFAQSPKSSRPSAAPRWWRKRCALSRIC
ncbi:hypothetical protein [Cyanobium sp. LEGE 06113]|uniref:hypothetical protein n=1 Tax=Cyanobium sp. LEGE 06113 TaxID=1297573 RepID=UPI001D13F258|nr:hypothetical protein [Cyanobium sp. LEGE 06113]